MKQQDKIICIFGGTGFLGRHITQELARAGFRIKIITRIPESVYELKTYGAVGQVVSCTCDYSDEKEIVKSIQGAYAVINLIGILYQKKKNKFSRVHAELSETIAKNCKKQSVEKLIHVSALGIEKSQSKYAKSKLEGEQRVLKEFSSATILRPSVVFGSGDSFFNMFSKLSTLLPALPLIGGGKTRFQPVYVGDIAEAVKTIVMETDDIYQGNIYELGGPEVITFKEVYERLFKETNRRCTLINLPWPVATMQGALMSCMPKPLLTADQVKSLKTDNVVQPDALTLENLGVAPTAMDAILPKYLACYKRGGRFANKKVA